LATCFNCGEEGHVAANCQMEKRKKPCFVCGLFGHNAKQCTQVGLPCSEGLSLGDLDMSIHALAELILFVFIFCFEYNLFALVVISTPPLNKFILFRFQFMKSLKSTSAYLNFKNCALHQFLGTFEQSILFYLAPASLLTLVFQARRKFSTHEDTMTMLMLLFYKS
jgi:hypothetical protein